MRYTILSSMVIALLAVNQLYAATDPVPGAARQAAAAQPPGGAEQREIEPAMLVEQGMNKMLAFLSQEQRPDKETLMGFLDKEIALFFDFPYMAKSAAGPVYRHMDQDQRDRMSDNIQQQFLAAMTARLTGYDNQQVRVVSQRFGRGGNTATVSVAVLQPRGYPARLDFRFYRSKTGWRVFDVSANGQSAVVHYRRQFRQTMQAARYQSQEYSGQYQTQRPYHRLISQ